MPWSLKRWWQWVGITTVALELICLVLSPNPISIFLLPIGMALIGAAFPIAWDAATKTFDQTKEWSSRVGNLVVGLFCLGIIRLGVELVLAALVAALAVLGWKLDGG